MHKFLQWYIMNEGAYIYWISIKCQTLAIKFIYGISCSLFKGAAKQRTSPSDGWTDKFRETNIRKTIPRIKSSFFPHDILFQRLVWEVLRLPSPTNCLKIFMLVRKEMEAIQAWGPFWPCSQFHRIQETIIYLLLKDTHYIQILCRNRLLPKCCREGPKLRTEKLGKNCWDGDVMIWKKGKRAKTTSSEGFVATAQYTAMVS